MMERAILDFPQQFTYQPKIENRARFKRPRSFILVGMGGSHLNGDLVLTYNPNFPLHVRRDYGLPALPLGELKKYLIIASSYSGNTEEVVAAYHQARKYKLPLVCIAIGGKLIQMAKRDRVPYIQMPNTGIQPRNGLGFSFRALLTVLGEGKVLTETEKLAQTLQPRKLMNAGQRLAEQLKNYAPIFYCSRQNETVAWNWKIKMNETGKIPAFYNVLPELNHNEMTSFDVKPRSRALSRLFHFVMLSDASDDPHIQKRMKVLEWLYRSRKLPVINVPLRGKSHLHKIFSSLILADWTALYTAKHYGLEPEKVPMVEEFKKLIG